MDIENSQITKGGYDMWLPEQEEKYYYIIDDGWIGYDYWVNCRSEKDTFDIGNIFKTEDSALFMIERLKVLHELKKFARPFKRGEKNYYLVYRHDEGITDIDLSIDCSSNELYFDSEEDVLRAIESIGEDRIKEYYLCVSDCR